MNEKKKPSKFRREFREVYMRSLYIWMRILSYPFNFVREFIVQPLKSRESVIRGGVHFQGVKIKQTPMWKRTDDVQGHEPMFTVHCHFCDCPMALRHSVIFVGGAPIKNISNENNINQMSYKCPKCAWFVQFTVSDEAKYLRKVKYEYRHGSPKFLPTVDDWSKHSEIIKKQLAALGYFGGREM